VGPHASAWVALLVADAGAAQELSDCKTIIWNGPMGVFEFEKFAKGTNDVATTLAECTAKVRADSLSADMLACVLSDAFRLAVVCFGPATAVPCLSSEPFVDQYWMSCTAR
jgi:uncharacterized pyridoxal phosphate-containing UPF0001 family protein